MINIFLLLVCLHFRPARSFSPRKAAVPATPYFHAAHQRRSTPPMSVLFAASGADGEDDEAEPEGASSVNVLGSKMECCCSDVANTGIGTGFYRNGYCSTGPQDFGRHTVCVKVTDKFLEFSKNVGNDLSTPVPEYMFPGLSEGDVWCLCAQRWHQVWEAAPELAPKLYLKATHEKTLDYVPYDVLRMYAIDGEEADKEREGLDEQRARLEALLGKEAEKAEKPQEEE